MEKKNSGSIVDISDLGYELRIILRPRNDMIRFVGLIVVFFAAIAWGAYTILSGNLDNRDDLFWLLLSGVLALIASVVFLHSLFGKDILIVNGDGLVVRYELFGIGYCLNGPKEGLEICLVPSRDELSKTDLWHRPIGEDRLWFIYAGKKFSAGSHLSYDERKQLEELIMKRIGFV